jgi:hypothetical protein
MSSTHTVYVGPYAEWLLDRNLNGRTDELVDILGYEGERRGPDMLEVNIGHSGLPRLKRDGRELWCLCCHPYFDKYMIEEYAVRPPRNFAWGSYDARNSVLDLSQIDRAAEVSWFESTYGRRLSWLAGLLGIPPMVRWGVVSYES